MISKSGKLTKQAITNVLQSDGRCGVECSECDWALNADDMGDKSPFKKLAESAFAQQEQIDELSAKHKREK
ncbi:hypothetical protein [Marinomonas epiphytica]